MKQVPVRLGPLALLLTMISICLTILAILTFTTARADLRLAEKYAATVQARYALEVQGQEYLNRLTSGLETAPEADADGVCRVTLERDGTMLHIGLVPDGAGGYETVLWRHEKEWAQDEILDNLWGGSFGMGG